MLEPHYLTAPNLEIAPSPEALAQTAARRIVTHFVDLLDNQDRVVFIPSSGRSPVRTYEILRQDYAKALDWSRITVLQMDEYGSDSLPDTAYFQHFLQTHLVDPLGIANFISMRKPDRGGLWSPDVYKEKIEALGGIDFALHGIGRNGHIGFNEPGCCAQSVIRRIHLDDKTREDNFPNMPLEQAPKYGMTLGLAELVTVKKTLLIASGPKKREAITGLLRRDDPSLIPASVLWDSSNFDIVIDQSVMT